MINRKFFFDTIRARMFGGRMTASQVAGITAILDEWERSFRKLDDRFLAYILATAHHETDKKFTALDEYRKGKGKAYGKRLKYSGKPYTDTTAIFYGRGLVQLTWYENYAKAGKKFGLDMLKDPELAKRLDVAVKVLIVGMIEGWFTARKLAQYFTGKTENWSGARAIINGKDKQALIADYGRAYYSAISYTV